MPLYAFEGGGNRTVFSCRSCASRLILACHLVCALISSGINTRYLDLVYAPVKAKLEHLVQRRHACYHPRLNISRYYGSVYVICIWATATILLVKICHFFAQSGDESQWRRHFHNPFLSHDRSILAYRQMLTRSLSTARKRCLRSHATTHNKQIREIFIVTRHIPALVHKARQHPYHTQFPALFTSSN